MNKLNYYLHDCILQGWRNVGWAITAWKDLVTSNYENYDYFLDYTIEDKEESIRLDFWDSLEDDILPYELLTYLEKLVQEIESGSVRTISWEECKETLDAMFEDDVETN